MYSTHRPLMYNHYRPEPATSISASENLEPDPAGEI